MDARETSKKKYIGIEFDFSYLDSLKETIDETRHFSKGLVNSLQEKQMLESILSFVRRNMKVVLALIAISMAAGFGFAFYLKLGYITNYNDDRVVTDIEFLEYPEIKIQTSEYEYSQPFNWESEQNKTPGDIYSLCTFFHRDHLMEFEKQDTVFLEIL